MANTDGSTIRERWDRTKPTKTITFWLIIGAIVLTLILGFSKGGWVTESNAQHMAETAAQGAVIERLAPICVTQFNADPERTVKLEEMKPLSPVQRATFVKTEGWATMPGETSPDNRVATECAKQIALIIE
jgi:hypothetical protein